MRDLILIAGGSGSGKTEFCRFLLNRNPDFALLSTDDYYVDRLNLTADELRLCNFDHPDSIDFAALTADVKSLLAGQDIPARQYDFVRHHSFVQGVRHADFQVLIVEGIFALYAANLRNMAAATAFVAADDELRLRRRLERDGLERGRSVESITTQYATQVRPMYNQFVAPTMQYANVVVDNNVNENMNAAFTAGEFELMKLLNKQE